MVLEDNHYLFRLRAACIAQPEWNSHQLAALDHLVAIAARSQSTEEFLVETADLLELARATSLDRAWNLREAALRMDDPWLAAAAGLEYRHLFEARTYPELYAGQAASQPLREQSVRVASSADRLLICLLRWHTLPCHGEEIRQEIQTSFDTLVSTDAAFRADSWLQQPRYRWRVPWSTQCVHQWLQPLWPDRPADPPEIPEPTILPLREEWLIGLEHFEGVWPMVEPLERPDTGIFNTSQWHDPVLLRHRLQTERALASATTSISLEAISVERSLGFGIEATWNHLLTTSLLAPFTAAAFFAVSGEQPSTQAIETSYALTGCGPRALLGLPLVREFVSKNLQPLLTIQGAMHGEAGFELLKLCRLIQWPDGRIDLASILPGEEPPYAELPIVHWGNTKPLTSLNS